MNGLKLDPGLALGLRHSVELAAIEVEAAGERNDRAVVRISSDTSAPSTSGSWEKRQSFPVRRTRMTSPIFTTAAADSGFLPRRFSSM